MIKIQITQKKITPQKVGKNCEIWPTILKEVQTVENDKVKVKK